MAKLRIGKDSTHFPEVVYVYRDIDDEVDWLMVDEKAESLAIVGEKRLVGVYRLESVKNIVTGYQLEDVK